MTSSVLRQSLVVRKRALEQDSMLPSLDFDGRDCQALCAGVEAEKDRHVQPLK
jgi:hypothetical protein